MVYKQRHSLNWVMGLVQWHAACSGDVRRKSQRFLPCKLGFSHSTRCRGLAARRFPETGLALNLGILSGSSWKAGVAVDELGERNSELCSS